MDGGESVKILQEIDKYIFLKINFLPHFSIVDRMIVIIDLWYYFIIGALLLLSLNWVFVVKILLLVIFINSFLLKRLFKQIRISEKIDGVKVIDKPMPKLLKRMDNYSFPSGSAAISAAVTLALFVIGNEWGVFGIFMTLINGLQRLYTGAHLLSEVLGGWVSGSLTAMLILNLLK